MGSEANTDYCTNAMFTWKSTAGMGGPCRCCFSAFQLGWEQIVLLYVTVFILLGIQVITLILSLLRTGLACVVLVVAINPAIYTFLVFVLLLIAYYYYTTTPPPSLSLCLFWVHANLGLSSTLSHRPCQSISMGETQQS